MGMGVFAKAMDKSGANASTAGETSTAAGSAQRQRKWSAVEEQEEEDDRHIRFTIGGVGKRMTKEDFINELQGLDMPTRGEVVDKSDASQGLKALAKLDAASPQSGVSRTDHAAPPVVAITQPSPPASRPESRSPSPAKPTSPEMPSSGGLETAGAERSGRLVGPSRTGSGKTDDGETAAERRRREAALGMGPHQADGEEDSDDDDTPRVPPARKGIRFAEAAALERGRLRDERKE
jgi:sodium/hydrogen antiporter